MRIPFTEEGGVPHSIAKEGIHKLSQGSRSQQVGGDLFERAVSNDRVINQMSCISNTYITVHNSSKITEIILCLGSPQQKELYKRVAALGRLRTAVVLLGSHQGKIER